jgi:hypothetical protein
MGRLKRNRTADPLLEAAADAGRPPELNCRVDKSGQTQGSHTPPFAGSNPAPATSPDAAAMAERGRAASAEVEAFVAATAWHGPPRGRETVEEHHARWLRDKAETETDQLRREIYRVAAARLDGKEV